MRLCRAHGSVFVISQHNAAIQSLGKHMSHAELPPPVTAGKRSHLLSHPGGASCSRLIPPLLPSRLLPGIPAAQGPWAGEAGRHSRRRENSRIWVWEKRLCLIACPSTVDTSQDNPACF